MTIGDGPGDGQLGESDDVGPDVEGVRGGKAADRLAGDSGPNWLYGGAGADELDGSAGADVLYGEADADVLEGRDGEPDKLSCGSDLDSAFADPIDALAASCESVEG